MQRINRAFARLQEESRTGVIPYVMAGDPNLTATEELVVSLAAAGADLIELGVPFSDPVADGPVIQAAGNRALQAGVTMEGVLSLVERVRGRGVEIPLLLMSYYNPVFQRGAAAMARRLAESGGDGMIVPDLPVEESAELKAELEKQGLALIYLLAPTSTEKRIKMVAEAAKGFIYCVSIAGVTGARESLPPELRAFVNRVRSFTSLPLAVGFGISQRLQIEEVGQFADAAVVGSVLVAAEDKLARFRELKGERAN